MYSHILKVDVAEDIIISRADLSTPGEPLNMNLPRSFNFDFDWRNMSLYSAI